MLNNFLKVTFRNLSKSKTYSFLNIFGLAIGIACASLIFLWVEDELTWDQVHAKKDYLYYVRENQKYDTYTATFGSTPGLMAPVMQAEIPGIANTCRTSQGDMSLLFTIDNKPVYANGKYAEPSLFSMFSFDFVQGNAKTAFSQLYSLVITQKTAKKFFGNQANVIGRTVRVDNKQDYVVAGVIKDIPDNSSVQFEWVAPFEIWFKKSEWLHHWGNSSLSTYVELKPGVAPASVNKLLYNFIQKREPRSIAHPFLFSMNDWHLYDQFDNGVQTGGGQIEYVRMFSIIAWIILFIACINFMNLATARSEKRAREVGVRKVLGADKKRLVSQFIGEAIFMALIAAVFAVIMIGLTLPLFNTLVQKNLSAGFNKPLHLAALMFITLLCGIVAGSYPSLYLSSFNPIFVLKGLKLKSGSAAFIRKALVIVQFSVSIILIICTIIVYQQIQHVKSRDMGFDKKNLLSTDVVGDLAKNYSVIKQELLNTGMIQNVALSDHETIYSGNNTDGLTWDGKAPGAKILISTRYVTPEFIQTTGLKILEGRDFEETDSAVASKNINIIITQSLEKLMGTGSAIGKKIHYEGDSSVIATVTGVVNDYMYGNMYGKPDPVVFVCTAPHNTTLLYARINPGSDTKQTISAMEAILKKYNPAYPFSYVFVDDRFNNMFSSEALISKLSRVFAVLAIIISCLGLFGLAAYTAERRTKEVGIRKVLGASISGLAGLLSKDFIKLVCISCIVAFPIAWWAMHNWLQGYAYRIGMNVWVFAAAGIIAVLIALITDSFQAIRAAIANPVTSLRNE